MEVAGSSPDTGSSYLVGNVLHYAYGGGMGIVFALLANALGFSSLFWLWGIVWGVVLLMMMWGPITGMSKQMREMERSARSASMMASMVAHIGYGLVTGLLTPVFS